MDLAFILGAQEKTPHVVLGLRLLPMTVGHAFLLHEMEASYLSPTGEASVEDIIASAFVLGMPHREARRLLGTIRAKLFCAIWGWRCRKCNLAIEVSKFSAYLREQFMAPAMRSSDPDRTRYLNAPEHWRLLAMLMSVYGMSEAEAMDVPLVKARCLGAVESERAGAIELTHTRSTDILLHKVRNVSLQATS